MQSLEIKVKMSAFVLIGNRPIVRCRLSLIFYLLTVGSLPMHSLWITITRVDWNYSCIVFEVIRSHMHICQCVCVWSSVSHGRSDRIRLVV